MGDEVLMVIEGIVLAAGLSERAGTFKMTLKIGESTVIEKCIQGMYDLCSRLVVVGGYRMEKLVDVLDKYPKVDLVFNKDYRDGMFSSVKEGFRHVREDRFFITPGDYPMIAKSVYEAMIKLDGDIIVPVCGGKTGHPVLFKYGLAKELLQDTSYVSLREFIGKRHPVYVDVKDPGILMDIDTMKDYLRIADIFRRSGIGEQ
jgi:molybdenum cofactor cytidylyltransferase